VYRLRVPAVKTQSASSRVVGVHIRDARPATREAAVQPRVHARGAVRVRLVSAPRLIVRVSQQKLGAAGRWLGHHVAVVEPGALELA